MRRGRGRRERGGISGGEDSVRNTTKTERIGGRKKEGKKRDKE